MKHVKECAERLEALADKDRLLIVQFLRGGEKKCHPNHCRHLHQFCHGLASPANLEAGRFFRDRETRAAGVLPPSLGSDC